MTIRCLYCDSHLGNASSNADLEKLRKLHSAKCFCRLPMNVLQGLWAGKREALSEARQLLTQNLLKAGCRADIIHTVVRQQLPDTITETRMERIRVTIGWHERRELNAVLEAIGATKTQRSIIADIAAISGMDHALETAHAWQTTLTEGVCK